MKPVKLNKHSAIKRAKYRVHWYKDMKTLLKKIGKTGIDDQMILLS